MKRTVALALSLGIVASCVGLTAPQGTEGPAAQIPPASVTEEISVIHDASATAAPVAPVPAVSLQVPASTGSNVPVSTTSAVGPLLQGSVPCFADRYPCETFDFSLVREGSIEVTVSWEGPPRALMVQLYWAGEGLAHEEVAPRDGPSQIWFRRPRMEAAGYTLRVVSLEPNNTIPFTLALTY